MAHFHYQAVNKLGKRLHGKMQAVDETGAVAELRKRGIYPTKLAASVIETGLQREINLGFLMSKRVRLQDVVAFCRQFATLVRVGVSITQSLDVLASQSENRKLKHALEQVHAAIRQGVSLEDAFSKHREIFTDMFASMVGAGEHSGQLETMLDRMATFFERQLATSRKLVSALTYPITVFTIAIGVSIFLLTSIVPIFAQSFAQQGVELPLATKITLSISGFLIHRWYIVLLIAIFTVLTIGAVLRTSYGRLLWHSFKLRIPVFGKLYQRGIVARFARTFSTLEASAVPILDGLDLIKKIIANKLFDNAMEDAQQSLRNGERLSDSLKKYPNLFPVIVTQMVAIGEETGELESLLGNLADYYEAEVTEISSRLSSLMEPLMILFLASIVGVIILSVYLPMFSMMDFVQ